MVSLSRQFQKTFIDFSVLDNVEALAEILEDIFAEVIEEEMLEEAAVELPVGIDGTARPSVVSKQ